MKAFPRLHRCALRVLALLVLPLLPCCNDTSSSTGAQEAMIFRNETDQLSVWLPSGWRQAEFDRPGISAVLAGPVVDGFATNVACYSQPSSAPLEEFVSQDIATSSKEMAGFAEIERKPISLSDAISAIRFTTEHDARSGRRLRTQVYVLALRQTKVFLVFSRPSGEHPELDGDFQQIMDSMVRTLIVVMKPPDAGK
jgi:hypothetical protein